MRAKNYLNNHRYQTTEADLKKLLNFPADDPNPLHIYKVWSMPGHDLTLFTWRCGDFHGFLRDDSTGWSGATMPGESHDDELWLAAQFADYDAKAILKRKGDKIDWAYITELARENQWLDEEAPNA